MSESPTVFPPSSIDDVILRISEMSAEAYDVLKGDVRHHGFDAQRSRCERLSKSTGMSAETIAVILSALSFMYTRIATMHRDQASQALAALVDERHRGESQPLVQRLQDIMAPSAEIDISRKVVRLRSGFLKTATTFSSFVDVRPDFEEGNERIRALVPMVQFRVTTDAENVAEREFVFQTDGAGLKAMRDAVEAAEKKLKTIEQANALSVPFHIVSDQ